MSILAVAIRTFKCADPEALFGLRRAARFPNIERPALRKLKRLDLARRIEDVCAPSVNRLEN
jgi:toxin HigB-1